MRIVKSAAGASRNNQQVRYRTVQHHRLAAVENPLAGLHARSGLHTCRGIARGRFAVRESELELAARNARQKDLALLVGTAEDDSTCTEHDRSQVGLDHQPPSERLHHQHDVDRAAAEAVMLRRNGQAEQAHRCESFPCRWTHPEARVDDLSPCLEAVALGQKLLEGVLEELLLFGVVEVHLLTFRSGKPNPRQKRRGTRVMSPKSGDDYISCALCV